MTQGTDFFDNLSEGSGAPSPSLKVPGDFVFGEIVKLFKKPFTSFGSKDPERRADGSIVQQLVIVLQTEHRNWENVTKVPKVDPADPNSAEKAPSEDTGERAVYVPEGKNIQFAIGRAIQEAKAPFVVGGKLGVKVVNLRDTGKGNPLKEHEAKYGPPSAEAGFFGDSASAQQAPAAAAPAAPAAEAPVQQEAPAPAAAPATPPAGDPWAASSGAPKAAPPF